MSDFPHGHPDHSGWGCNVPECAERIAQKQDIVNEMLANATVIEHEHGITMHNMGEGKWVQQRDGSLISLERAQEMNRAQRRKLGIRL